MREILFRGKRFDNGKWVEGLLWKKKYDTPKLFVSYFPNKDDDEDVVVIDPETVGQYSGLTDKNGKKIFEGDIVKAELRPCVYQDSYAIGYVNFEDGTFKIKVTCSKNAKEHKVYCGEEVKSFAIENNFINRGYVLNIIGNIYDNPELLQE